MRWNIPGRAPLTVSHVVLDYNGTLAVDGEVAPSVRRLLKEVSMAYHAILATADTFGTAAQFAEDVGLELHVVGSAQDKEALVRSFFGGVAAIGNGANDALMFRAADLGIAIVGGEGVAVPALQAADIVVPSIERGLELLLYPKRLVATLRL